MRLRKIVLRSAAFSGILRAMLLAMMRIKGGAVLLGCRMGQI